MMNRFVIAEPDKCIGCRTCEIACALAHPVGAIAAPLTPATFAPRLTVVKGMKISTPVLCRHCEDAPCVNVCPNGAIVYRQNSVQVLQDRCVGCKTCMVACPYGAMNVVARPAAQPAAGYATTHAIKAEVQKCDLCVDHAGGPACIPSCPTKALHLVDRNTMDAARKSRQERAALDMTNGRLF
ncbi:4Fe-4S dicluster domain-containing protein [Paludibacterium yongneupense]|uniref:4Fe-4S dicluster domain-containing protein n=1 Tax=Paludibacterium yongneupense TaxID=400061 RepID=UPI000403EA7C|nr:4Fe-4S dicluster domain-containing protein [Paludibacterium yongneupense]